MLVKPDRAREALQCIEKALHSGKSEITEDGEIRLFEFNDAWAVNRLLYQNGFEVDDIYMYKQDLEEYFTNLMGVVSNA